MPEVKLGLDAVLKVDGVVIGNCKDLTVTLEKAEADASTRDNNGWRATVGTLKDASIEFQVVNKDGDTAFTDLQTLYMSGDPVDVEISDVGATLILIRHGYISSQIRSQFETWSLATRQAQNGEYQDNEYWMERFSHVEHSKRQTINRRMKVFSSQLDDLVEEVNSEWIRIKGDEHPNGMFDFDIEENQLTLLFMLAAQKSDHLSFFDFIIEYLWQKTEVSLQNIRSRITGELLSEALKLLHDLERDVIAISPKVASTNFSAVVASCGNEVQADFRLFAEWFRRSSGPVLKSFTFDLVLDVASKTAMQFHPDKNFQLTRKVPQHEFEGSWFKPLVEIMVILLDNLLKNARTPLFRPECVVTFDGESTLSIQIENSLGKDVNLDELRQKVDEINEEGRMNSIDYAKLQSEGNSGIPKIRKLVKEDLRQRESQVACTVTCEGKFRVLIEMHSIKMIRGFR